MISNLVNFSGFMVKVRQLGYPPVTVNLNPIAEASVLAGGNEQFVCSFLTKEHIRQLVAEYPLFDPSFDIDG